MNNSMINLGDYKIPEGKNYLVALEAAWSKSTPNLQDIFVLECAPLIGFLELNFPISKDFILPWMVFLGVSGNHFKYKNKFTRGYIVIDHTGQVVSQDVNAVCFG